MRLFQAAPRSCTQGLAFWRSCLLLLFAVRLVPAADAVLTDFVPRDTKVVVGIRMRNIVELLQSQNFAAAWGGTGPALLAKSPLAGFDPLKDLDEVLIASTGDLENPPAFLVLRGRFDIDLLATRGTSYHGVTILEYAGNSSAMAILDASTAIVAELPQLRAVIDQPGGEAGIGPALAARIEPLRSRYTIWGIGDLPERAPAHPGKPAAEPNVTDSVDHFEFGAEISHGLDLTADIHVRSPEDAEKMASSFGFIEAMLKSPAASPSGARFDLRTENGSLHVALTVPEEEWNKAVREQTVALQSAFVSRLPAELAAQLSPVAAPASSRKPASRAPAPSDGSVRKNAQGDTVVVTLPGGR